MASNDSIDTEAAHAIVLLSLSLSMTATAAVSPYRGTPVDDTPTNHSLSSSLASAHPTEKSLPRLIDDKDRRQHLKKYNKLIKAGFEKSGAAAEVGYSLRAFQL